jgi:N utilization substance protein B
VALQVLYAMDLSGAASAGPRPAIQEVFERVTSNFDLQPGAREFAETLVLGVAGCREDLDARIGTHSSNWRVERMAAVDRNVLRLASWELVYTDTPETIVIDEAIELARDFGSERSPSFVNGVLDAIARDRKDARGAEGDAPPVRREPAIPT